MENTCKKISWFNISSLASILLGMIFGIVAITSLPSEVSQQTRYVFIGVLVIVTIVSLISGLITFFGMRKGQVKTSVLGMGRNSSIQLIGPFTAFVMGMIGLNNQSSVNHGMVTFLSVTFVIMLFATGLCINSLRGYRKDKETYNYTYIVSFIAAVAILVFAVAAMIGQFQLPSSDTHYVGYLIAFSLLFSLSDLLCFIGLGILSFVATKKAPKVTMADADAATLDKIVDRLDNKPQEMDNVTKLREYKKLLDEGVITQEEFDAKKKELL